MRSGIIAHAKGSDWPVPTTVTQARRSSCSTVSVAMLANGWRQRHGYLSPIVLWDRNSAVMAAATGTLRTYPGRLLLTML